VSVLPDGEVITSPDDVDDVVPLPDTVVPGLDNVDPDDVIIVLGDVLMLGMVVEPLPPPLPLALPLPPPLAPPLPPPLAPPPPPAVVCAWSMFREAVSSFQALIPFKMLTISRARTISVA
jgi:hypothetical protein